MNIAILSLTKGGYELALKISDNYSESVIFSKYSDGRAGIFKIEENFRDLVEEVFYKYDFLIFIMSTGIVVRTIAPLIVSKLSDPGILVIDEKGKNVISLLSGHIGGANKLALDLAEFLKSNPVITTASDVNGKIAIDSFAKENDLIIENMNDAKKIASIIVNGGNISFKSDDFIQYRSEFLEKYKEFFDENLMADGSVILTNRNISKDSIVSLALIPRNIVIGIGCRRGMEFAAIRDSVEKALEAFSLNKASIKNISTVDVKKDEKGIIETAEFFQVPLIIIGRDEIEKVQHKYEISEFVMKTIGIGAVCEPVAELSSNKPGRFLMRKKSYDGITIAIWEEIYEIG